MDGAARDAELFFERHKDVYPLCSHPRLHS